VKGSRVGREITKGVKIDEKRKGAGEKSRVDYR